jgi:CheY-like chemotaxis protein
VADLQESSMPYRPAIASNAPEIFAGRSILIVEDEYFLADDLASEFARRGAEIIGPVGEITAALDLLQSGARIDGALLDINVRDETIYPLARGLRERRIPFLFTTGYDTDYIRPEFADVPLCEKPLDLPAVVQCLAGLMPPA